MERQEFLISGLPDPAAASRFMSDLGERHPSHAEKLRRNEGLLSDVLTLASFSPLLASTLLQHPEHFSWLDRRRRDSGVRTADELVEGLAQFSATHSGISQQAVFAEFRRRELLRIFLRDVRRLATVAEVTEEISNLADAILSAALKLAITEIDNRFGRPQEADDKGRMSPARFCIVALGKLGSRELNYSSDIDLLFLYSGEGQTTGKGTRGEVTNREYFIKLAEHIVSLVGQRTGDVAAYRVDLRLRPHGSLGPIAMSVADIGRYYRTEARDWERQVLIRSRGCAGDVELYKDFFADVEPLVFSETATVETALENVRLSKARIDQDRSDQRGFDVKLGRGGIREIEFIAQALQLAHGGRDRWLRSPHTLISLARLADRGLISESEHTDLASAYEFLRRTEHILQMENGLQTHAVPVDQEKRGLVARRVEFAGGGDFETDLATATSNVSQVFARLFGEGAVEQRQASPMDEPDRVPSTVKRTRAYVMASLQKSSVAAAISNEVLDRVIEVSPHFAAMLAANPALITSLPDPTRDFDSPPYTEILLEAVESGHDLAARLAAMRQTRSRFMLDIVVRDIFETLTVREVKTLQTRLAEACIAVALRVVRDEMVHRFGPSASELDLSVLALGKMGGRGLDYDSDLDLIMVYFDPKRHIAEFAPQEFYARAVELFTTVLSAMTRDGSLYRVDLRLRPFGTKGMSAISIDAFLTYMQDTAAIWELLAFVKLRFVGGDGSIGMNVENETRRLIHERALTLDPEDLRTETRSVRLALEQQRGAVRRGTIDIKYGTGGMLDVYFATRYLQLRDNIPDDPDDRSTLSMLDRLRSHGSLGKDQHEILSGGYHFLSAFDHGLRLTVGRTTQIPMTNTAALETIAKRSNIVSAAALIEELTAHRIDIREAFDHILPA